MKHKGAEAKHRADFYSRLSLRERTPERHFRGAKGDTFLPQDANVLRLIEAKALYIFVLRSSIDEPEYRLFCLRADFDARFQRDDISLGKSTR